MARDALLGYAASAGTNLGAARPGELPCPAADFNTGIPQSCSSQGLRIGYLPWNRLGLPALRDGSGAPLLYAVSDRFKTDPRHTSPLNLDVSGDYTVDGQNAVAVVFAPGAALSNQNRAATTFNIANFLELGNADGNTIFETALESSNFNDRLLWITPPALFKPVELRVARIAKQRLLDYFNLTGRFPMAARYLSDFSCWDYGGRLPYPDAAGTHPCLPEGNGVAADRWVTDFPQWFWQNYWDYMNHYAPARRCVTNTGTICGGTGNYLTVGTQNNIHALLISQGIRSPASACSLPSQCLDDAENANQDSIYVIPSAGNDRMTIVST